MHLAPSRNLQQLAPSKMMFFFEVEVEVANEANQLEPRVARDPVEQGLSQRGTHGVPPRTTQSLLPSKHKTLRTTTIYSILLELKTALAHCSSSPPHRVANNSGVTRTAVDHQPHPPRLSPLLQVSAEPPPAAPRARRPTPETPFLSSPSLTSLGLALCLPALISLLERRLQRNTHPATMADQLADALQNTQLQCAASFLSRPFGAWTDNPAATVSPPQAMIGRRPSTSLQRITDNKQRFVRVVLGSGLPPMSD